jgi:hypothetical protein
MDKAREIKDMDFSSLWSWTLPLWGLAVLILFLGGALTEEPDLTRYVKPTMSQTGGSRTNKKSQ